MDAEAGTAMTAAGQRKAWRGSGQAGPAVGWFCTYTPIELVVAAGANPVRVFAEDAPAARADKYLPPNLCPYARACLAWGVEKAAASLAGVILVHSCNGMSQLASAWRRYVPVPVVAEVDAPRDDDGASVGYMVHNMRQILAGLRDLTGRAVDPSSLAAAISAVESVRRRWRDTVELRAGAEPALRGAQISSLAKKVLSRGPGEALGILEDAGRGPSPRPGPARGAASARIRLLLVGSVIPDAILRAVEAAGADVVYDESCSGGRSFTVGAAVRTTRRPAAGGSGIGRSRSGDCAGDSAYGGHDGLRTCCLPGCVADPATGSSFDARLEHLLEGLARAYLSRTPCARMKTSGNRAVQIAALARLHRTDGVISCTLKFCDPYLYEQPLLRAAMERAGLPFLPVTTEYGRRLEGRVLTRIEAFLEMIAANPG